MSAPVRVEVRLTSVAGVDDAAWAAAATAAANRLVAALALPVEPIVAVAPATVPLGDAAPSYSLEIGGAPARLAWRAAGDVDTIAASALRLQYDLARNGQLFVTEAVAEEVRARWAMRAPEHAALQLSIPDLARVLGGCVRAGRRIDRVLEGDPGPDERDPLWWRLLEGALDASPSLRLVLPLRFGHLLDDRSDITFADALSDHAYEQSGVVVPPAEAGIDEHADDEWRLELCDLTLGAPTPPSADELANQIGAALRPWLDAFVTRETTRYRLDEAARELPHLVKIVRERFGDAFITRSLRALVEEGVPVRDLRTILGGLAEIREATKADEETRIVFHAPAGTPPPELVLRDGRLDPEDAADCVRRWARRVVTQSHWNGGTLRTRLLAPTVEAGFRTGPMVPGSADHRTFLQLVGPANEPILTNVDIRRRVFEAIAVERPNVAVLCYQELLPETNVIPTGTVGA